MRKAIVCLAAMTITLLGTNGLTTEGDQPATLPQRVEVGQKRGMKKKSGHHKQNHSNAQAKCYDPYCQPYWYQPTYYIKSIGADGGTIVTTDETVWAIADSSAWNASRWYENTPVVITPSRWYSKYDYYLVNKLTNESVTAKLSQGPFLKYSVLIQTIDPSTGFVSLSNGTRWFVSRDSAFYYWQPGQAVLMGENTVWGDKKNILININENNYLSADILP